MTWSKVVSSHPSSHYSLVTFALGLVLLMATLPSPSHCMPLGSSSDISSVDFAQLQSLVREALKYMQKYNRDEPTRIIGQVNTRYPRSDLGDVALRLFHLQEMDRKYGAKARPRFGKRNEVTQDNFIPMYGDEDVKDSTIGANGESPPLVSSPLLFIP
ncbi:unnamed protein product [Orchesella dallaii]|uniref:Neuropeptide F n=1 Tax=Orchesella dallaii TaxID=48710 RepID=A0ABP1PQW4_9HEXA